MHHVAERRTAAKSWRQWAAELRQVATTTRDPQLRRRYVELADRWDEEASEEEPPALASWRSGRYASADSLPGR